MPTMPDLDELTCRWSSRERKAPDRFDPTAMATTKNIPTSRFKSVLFTMVCLVLSGTSPTVYAPKTLCSKVVYHTQEINKHFDGTLNYLNPLAYATEKSDNETYTFREMLQQEDKNEFIMAMIKEISDHEQREHWHLFPRADIPKDHKTILAIWSFKRKRFPDGRVMKYKARLCAHGGMQQ